MADGDTSGTVGSETELSVSFDKIQVPLDFLVIDNPPFDVIIGHPTLESLQARIDLGIETVTSLNTKGILAIKFRTSLQTIENKEIQSER